MTVTECSWCDDPGNDTGVACNRHDVLAHYGTATCCHPAKTFEDWCLEPVVATDGVLAWCATHKTADSFPVTPSGRYVTLDDIDVAVTLHDHALDIASGLTEAEIARARFVADLWPSWGVPAVVFTAVMILGWLAHRVFW